MGLDIGTDVLAPNGSAASLTSIPAAQITGTVPAASLASATVPASQISGVIDAANLGTGASSTNFLRGDGQYASAGGGGAWVKSTSGSFTSQANLDFIDLPDNCRISIQFSNGFGNPLQAFVSNDNAASMLGIHYNFSDAELVPGQTRWVFGSTSNNASHGAISMGATGYITIYWQFGQNANLQTLVTWYAHAVQGASASNTQTWTNIGHGLHNANGVTNALRLTQAAAVSGNFSIDVFTT